MPVKRQGPDETLYRIRMDKQTRADLRRITEVLHDRGAIGHSGVNLDAKKAMAVIIGLAKGALGLR
jgi:hypothetical protein